MVPDGYRAWQLAGCHYADVHQLSRRLAAGLRPRVRFAEGVAVTGLTADSGAVTVTTGTGERLVADYLVLAPGPWLGAPAWRDLVAPLGLRVKKVVALHIGQRPGPEDQAMLFDADDAFLLPVAHQGHWLFSYASQEWDVDPDAPAAGLSAAEVGAARDLLRRYAPSLAAALRRRAGSSATPTARTASPWSGPWTTRAASSSPAPPAAPATASPRPSPPRSPAWSSPGWATLPRKGSPVITSTYDSGSLHTSFGIDLGEIDMGAVEAFGVGANWGRVPPGRHSDPHQHDETETFVIVAGSGDIVVDSKRAPVGPGMVLQFEPFETHYLDNTGDR